MIRIGLLGASKIAPKAIIRPAQARQDCVIQAVASRSETRARDYANQYGIPHYETSYEALIARDDIDLIYNALPPNRHCDLSILAAQQGKAVLCEKPFAMNAGEARRMVEAADDAGTVLIEGFHYRFHPSFLKFEQEIKSRKIGDIEEISGVFDVHIPNHQGELRYLPELGGGALMDLGCYPLHAMRTLTGQEPIIHEAIHGRDDNDVAIASWASMDFNGVPAHLETNMGSDAPYENAITIKGSKGVAKLSGFVHPYRWDPHIGFDMYINVGSLREVTTLLNSPESWKRSTYAYQLDHVVSVISGEIEPLTGGPDAIATMAAIDAILAAS
ncbi:MAG: Gfo/Idh/MocA family oxidoreductase [Litorimonas sp.]